jgi:hypothetical protein
MKNYGNFELIFYTLKNFESDVPVFSRTNLWSNISRTSNIDHFSFILIASNSKVNQLDLIILSEHNILWFNLQFSIGLQNLK